MPKRTSVLAPRPHRGATINPHDYERMLQEIAAIDRDEAPARWAYRSLRAKNGLAVNDASPRKQLIWQNFPVQPKNRPTPKLAPPIQPHKGIAQNLDNELITPI